MARCNMQANDKATTAKNWKTPGAMVSVRHNLFLEKNKLKDDSSNDAYWVRHLRIILIATQKNYVLYAPLDDRPIAGTDAHVMNI